MNQARDSILETIRAIPIVDTLKLRIDELTDGHCRAFVPRDRCYDGIYESLHGGILMTIADSIACFAVMSRTGPEQAMTTTDMNIRFLAPCLTDVSAVARVVKFGRTLCPVAVDLWDARERLVAFAQVTYMLLDQVPGRMAPPADSGQINRPPQRLIE